MNKPNQPNQPNESETIQLDVISLIELQRKLDRMLGELRNRIIDDIRYTDNSVPESPAPSFMIVQFSELVESSVWDPKYYSQDDQAKAVEKELETCKSIQSLMRKVAGLVEIGRVDVGNNRVVLNKRTLLALRSSELYLAFVELERKED